MNPLVKRMLNRGNSRERAAARALMRGRGTPELRAAAEWAASVAKDFGGAGPATGTPAVAADVHTPVPGGPKRVARKSRLAIPWAREMDID